MDLENFDYIKILKEVDNYPLEDVRKELFFMSMVGGLISGMDIQTATYFAYNKLNTKK